MARYIDADKFIAHLKDELKECEIPLGSRANGKGIAYGTALGLKSAISFADTLSTADVVPKSEVERLQAEKDALIKNYAECMKDYASEIFADVNMRIISYSTDIYIKGEELIIIPKSDYNAILAALIKKYTEGEDKPAASEEKYFSPGDVAKMTHQEVREKYTAIRKSMKRW